MKISQVRRAASKQFDFSYCDKIIDFFDSEPYKINTFTNIKGGMETQLIPCAPPMFERFASEIGVSSRLLNKWRNEYEEFDEACEIAKDLQEYIVVTNSLMGLYEKTFSKMFMKNKLGWTETVTQDITGKVTLESLMSRIAENNKGSNFIEQKTSALELIENVG